MVTFEEIKDGIIKSLQDSSVAVSTIENLINSGVQFVSERVRLPALDVSGSVNITSDANFVTIPSAWNYQRGLYDAISGDKQVLTIYPSIMSLRRTIGDTSEIQTGQTQAIAVVGDKLHYHKSSTTTLNCRFFCNPSPLVNDTDELTCIPGGHAKILIESYVLAYLFALSEDGVEGPKTNTRFHQLMFERYLEQLDISIESGQPAPEQVRYPFWKI